MLALRLGLLITSSLSMSGGMLDISPVLAILSNNFKKISWHSWVTPNIIKGFYLNFSTTILLNSTCFFLQRKSILSTSISWLVFQILFYTCLIVYFFSEKFFHFLIKTMDYI